MCSTGRLSIRRDEASASWLGHSSGIRRCRYTQPAGEIADCRHPNGVGGRWGLATQAARPIWLSFEQAFPGGFRVIHWSMNGSLNAGEFAIRWDVPCTGLPEDAVPCSGSPKDAQRRRSGTLALPDGGGCPSQAARQPSMKAAGASNQVKTGHQGEAVLRAGPAADVGGFAHPLKASRCPCRELSPLFKGK